MLKEELLTLCCHMPRLKLSREVWKRIRHLKINAVPPTRRGTRGGVLKPRAIHVQLGKRCERDGTSLLPRASLRNNLVLIYCASFIPVRVTPRRSTAHHRESGCRRERRRADCVKLVHPTNSAKLGHNDKTADNFLKLISLNCLSVANKALSIADLVISANTDLSLIHI